jgi:hypothetical protein
MGISFFKKKRRHWLEDFAWRVERVTQKFRLSSVSFLSVYLFSVTPGKMKNCLTTMGIARALFGLLAQCSAKI